MWGATFSVDLQQYYQPISIHAPMWGATRNEPNLNGKTQDFNPRTHVGCDLSV